MQIEFNSVIGSINNTIYSIPFLHTILSNVIYTSIILSILLIIVMVLILPSGDMSPWMIGKMFFYLTIVNTIILSSYNSVISNKYKEQMISSDNTQFINNVTHGGNRVIYESDSVKVTPNFKHEDGDEYASDEASEAGGGDVDAGMSNTRMLDMLEKQL
jgi:hypothetical protein